MSLFDNVGVSSSACWHDTALPSTMARKHMYR